MTWLWPETLSCVGERVCGEMGGRASGERALWREWWVGGKKRGCRREGGKGAPPAPRRRGRRGWRGRRSGTPGRRRGRRARRGCGGSGTAGEEGGDGASVGGRDARRAGGRELGAGRGRAGNSACLEEPNDKAADEEEGEGGGEADRDHGGPEYEAGDLGGDLRAGGARPGRGGVTVSQRGAHDRGIKGRRCARRGRPRVRRRGPRAPTNGQGASAQAAAQCTPGRVRGAV